jgi:glycine cleavage system H protein
MKEIQELNLPDDVRYSEEHEWAKADGENIKVGVSDYAQDQLGDIVFVELPQEGDTFASGDEFGTVESVKAVSELYIPVGGEIVSVNTELEDAPELVNTSPHDKGWMIEIKPSDPAEMDSLMSKEDYINFLKGI